MQRQRVIRFRGASKQVRTAGDLRVKTTATTTAINGSNRTAGILFDADDDASSGLTILMNSSTNARPTTVWLGKQDSGALADGDVVGQYGFLS